MRRQKYTTTKYLSLIKTSLPMAVPTSRGLQLLRRVNASSYVCSSCSRFTTSAVAQSGHNRWSKIKHDKAGVDKKKNLERSQLARDIMQASRRTL